MEAATVWRQRQCCLFGGHSRITFSEQIPNLIHKVKRVNDDKQLHAYSMHNKKLLIILSSRALIRCNRNNLLSIYLETLMHSKWNGLKFNFFFWHWNFWFLQISWKYLWCYSTLNPKPSVNINEHFRNWISWYDEYASVLWSAQLSFGQTAILFYPATKRVNGLTHFNINKINNELWFW